MLKLETFMIGHREKISGIMELRNRILLLFSIMMLVGGILSSLILVYALTDYTKDLPSSYGGSCQVCHVSSSGGGDLNGFGSDYAEHGNDIGAISKLDSDDDGANNEKELKAGTFPGNPDSSPQGIPGYPYESIVLGIAMMVVLYSWMRRGT
jgi:hypothetical protein